MNYRRGFKRLGFVLMTAWYSVVFIIACWRIFNARAVARASTEALYRTCTEREKNKRYERYDLDPPPLIMDDRLEAVQNNGLERRMVKRSELKVFLLAHPGFMPVEGDVYWGILRDCDFAHALFTKWDATFRYELNAIRELFGTWRVVLLIGPLILWAGAILLDKIFGWVWAGFQSA